MRRMTIFAATLMLATGPAFGQSPGRPHGSAFSDSPATAPAAGQILCMRRQSRRSRPPPPNRVPRRPWRCRHEPTFDEGTAQRIREAALSYSDLAVRGGWPTIPADAKFALGVAGPNDDLLRRRLMLGDDLAADKASGRLTRLSPRPSSASRCVTALPPRER